MEKVVPWHTEHSGDRGILLRDDPTRGLALIIHANLLQTRIALYLRLLRQNIDFGVSSDKAVYACT